MSKLFKALLVAAAATGAAAVMLKLIAPQESSPPPSAPPPAKGPYVDADTMTKAQQEALLEELNAQI